MSVCGQDGVTQRPGTGSAGRKLQAALGCRKTNHTLRRRRGNPVVPLGARKFSVRIAKRFQVVVHQQTRGSGPEDGCRILSISSSYSRSGATQTVSFPFLAPPQNFFF